MNTNKIIKFKPGMLLILKDEVMLVLKHKVGYCYTTWKSGGWWVSECTATSWPIDNKVIYYG